MAERAGPALILAGFGSSGSLQLTLEAQQMAVFAGRVLSLALPERLRALLGRQGIEIEPLDQLLTDRPFAEGYAAVAQSVLSCAKDDPPAMFLSQGSPLFVNAITRYLATEARKLELPVRILPGVSPLEVVVAEFGIDVGRAGLQTISAAGLLARPGATSPRMPLLVLEIAGLATPDQSAEVFGPLTEALRTVYPPHQPVTLVNMGGTGGVTRLTVALERFGELIPKIDTSSCLFIDIRRKPVRSPGPQEAE
jgi:hypothetical protein